MLTIRKNGGASVVSLPRSVLKALCIDNGSQLTYTIEGGALVLKPVESKVTMADIFAGVEEGEYAPTPEDEPFLNSASVGKEV